MLGRLTPGTYRFQVRSKSGTQTSGWEGYGFTVPVEPLNPPQITSANSTTVFGQEQWTIQWDKNDCGVVPDGYTWRWREKGGTSDINTPTKGTAKTATLTGGTNGTTYVFYVKAHNGTRESSEIQREILWGETLQVNPPENLTFRILNPPEGSNVRFIWEDPTTGLEPLRFNWTLTGPGPMQSGDQIQLRQSFSNLRAGTYAFAVRTDVRTSTSIAADVGTNVSTWETIGYVVMGDETAPGPITIEETAASIRNPDTWKGGNTYSRRATWEAAADSRVSGYEWEGTWSQSPRSGRTTTASRSVDLNHIPENSGSHTITVWSIVSGRREGFRSKEFNIIRRDLEPPENLRVETTGDPDAGWNHEIRWDGPLTGRLVTGFEYRHYEDDDTPPSWTSHADSPLELIGLTDGDWNIDVRSTDANGASDHTSISFKQPPDNLKMQPPEGVSVSVGSGANWNGATANWRPPSGENPLEPDSYRWRLRGAEDRDSEEGVQGLTHTFSDLEIGDYQFDILCVKEGYEDSDWVGASFTIAEAPPESPAGIRCADGSSRTKKVVSWRNPTTGTMPTGYEYRVTGASSIPSTQVSPLASQFDLDLETGKSTVYVLLTKGELKSEEVSVECEVAATKCNPPRDLTTKQSPNNEKTWTMQWKAPEAGDDAATVTGYKWELSGEKSENGTTGSTILTKTFTSLSEGDYSFRVRTVCDDEESDWSPTKDFSVAGEPINPPENIMITQDEDETPPRDVTVTWTGSSEGQEADGYKIRLSGTSTVAETDVSSATHTFPDLAEGSYTVHLKSTVGDKESDRESTKTFDVETPEALPVAPVGLTHSLSEDGTEVTYTWSYPSDGPEIDGFQVNQRPPGSGERLDKKTTTWQRTGLRVGNQYTMTVVGVDSDGKQGPPAEVSFTAEVQQKAPLTPKNFKEQIQYITAGIVGEGSQGWAG